MTLPILILVLLLTGCTHSSTSYENPNRASKVEVRQTEAGWVLLRNGNPYYIEGAGGRVEYIDRLKSSGGNSLRTWSLDVGALAAAQQQGMTVLMGLSMPPERHGFNYSDATAVASLKNRILAEVAQIKDHPALLMYALGNELDLNYTNLAVWNVVNDIAMAIKQIDPNHPVTTVLAGINRDKIAAIQARAPALDLLAINSYGSIASVPTNIRSYGWDKPYIITEWGPTGHWENGTTSWGAPVEQTSSEKAMVYQSRYEAVMKGDPSMNLGSYVFLWGQKQERTPTWYGLFLENGHATEATDVMQFNWTGTWPSNRAPQMVQFRLDSKGARDNLRVQTGKLMTAVATVVDPNGDPITFRYELLPESTATSEGGDAEERPQPINGLFIGDPASQMMLNAPSTPGNYRLFVYASDGRNKTATANIPFQVY
jgi:hypothetical protein